MRPFYTRREGPDGVSTLILGPLVRSHRTDATRRIQVFPNFFYSSRTTAGVPRSWWWMFFPILFVGTDDFLVFPLGGYSRGILGLHELVLVTPLYARSRQRDLVTRHVLWPFVAWGSDGKPGGRRRFRIAPFYGRRTWHGGERSGFVMWPFYTWRRKGDARAFFAFPYYGRNEAPTWRETTVLYPFWHRRRNFLTGEKDTALWPFWRAAGGADGLFVRRAWPLREYRRAGFTTTDVVAWPFWRRTYLDDGRSFGRLTWVVPFYRSLKSVSRPDGAWSRKTVVWPAARWERSSDGAREFVVPVLSPVDAPKLREFAEPIRPFVSLYRRRVAADGARDTSVLFGLFSGRKSKEGSSFQVPLLYRRVSKADG
ncbi:MAG: hypothetical protein ACREID_02895, partial [Planctomycetota bacterium]